MNKYIVLLLSLFIARQGVAQYQPQGSGSSVQFKIKNLGFNVTGSLSGLAGKIVFDPAKPEEASFDVSVDASTINTDNNMRDEHLRAETYFDVSHYPRIRLVSDRITQQKKGTYLFTGQLALKNHQKEISFPFMVTEAAGVYRFQGSFVISRKDFEIGGFSTISDQLEVTLDVTAK
ncbi:YceI family protein [Puia sp.]|jgi:polyisoprenoid-binding protein YceI|uniref:YceI family protein n=1 Tax=Puia sp. TaxID=2045100 RepID=UPI002F410B81